MFEIQSKIFLKMICRFLLHIDYRQESNNVKYIGEKIVTTKEKEKLLFEEWKEKQKHPYFISDGILDEEEWNNQSCKILYVLKEANWENADADLCEFLLSERSSSYCISIKINHLLCRCVHGQL